MNIEYDENKNRENIAKHGLSFQEAQQLDWESALIIEDNRQDYGEKRFRAMALLGNRLTVFVFTLRQNNIRAISFRKANKREINQYVKKIT